MQETAPEGTDASTSTNAPRPTEANATTTPIAPTRRVPETAFVTPVMAETASDPAGASIFMNARMITADAIQMLDVLMPQAREYANATRVTPETGLIALIWTNVQSIMEIVTLKLPALTG